MTFLCGLTLKMNENLDNILPEWADDEFDLQLAQQVDEYKNNSRFVTVNNEDLDKTNCLLYKTDRSHFSVCMYSNRYTDDVKM